MYAEIELRKPAHARVECPVRKGGALKNAATLAGSIISTDFEICALMSIPISAIARIAYGLTRDGSDPADCTRTSWPNNCRARPSAIWLRAEFATHKNKMLEVVTMVSRATASPLEPFPSIVLQMETVIAARLLPTREAR